MPSLKRLDAKTLVLHHKGKIIKYGEFEELYSKFKQLNHEKGL